MAGELLKDFLVREYRDELSEIVSYGCGVGWHGLTYTSDINRFHDQWESEIWDVVNELADDYGESALSFLSGANSVGEVTDLSDIKQLAVFVAVEHLAYVVTEFEPELLNEEEEEKEEDEEGDEKEEDEE